MTNTGIRECVPPAVPVSLFLVSHISFTITEFVSSSI